MTVCSRDSDIHMAFPWYEFWDGRRSCAIYGRLFRNLNECSKEVEWLFWRLSFYARRWQILLFEERVSWFQPMTGQSCPSSWSWIKHFRLLFRLAIDASRCQSHTYQESVWPWALDKLSMKTVLLGGDSNPFHIVTRRQDCSVLANCFLHLRDSGCWDNKPFHLLYRWHLSSKP